MARCAQSIGGGGGNGGSALDFSAMVPAIGIGGSAAMGGNGGGSRVHDFSGSDICNDGYEPVRQDHDHGPGGAIGIVAQSIGGGGGNGGDASGY